MRAREAASALARAITASGPLLDEVERWGVLVADALLDGGRLLVAGNGGSAAEAQHLTAELVGRFETERSPLSAIALHAETSSLTAIGNDYGYEQVFARPLRAHARPGDVVMLISTSGGSPNVLAAARTADAMQLTTFGLTGPGPNPLEELCTVCATVPCTSVPTIQEVHLLAVHALCAAVDRRVDAVAAADGRAGEVLLRRSRHLVTGTRR